MKQSAAERPDPTIQRKAAIARGAALEHTGKVRIVAHSKLRPQSHHLQNPGR